MSRTAPSLAVLLLTCALAQSAAAQDFDLPPLLPGDSAPAAEPLEPPAPSDTAADSTALPPVLEDAGEDLAVPDVAAAEEAPPRFSLGENATLELEARAFDTLGRDGGSDASLRLQAHYYGTRPLSDSANLIFNLRARATTSDNDDFAFEDDVNFDVQELAVNFAFPGGSNLQIGRTNIRNGVALGFNPTDWFRDDSLVLTGSAAPADRRRERLGVFALTGSTSIGSTLLQAGIRPEIKAGSNSIWAGADNVGLQLNRTNASDAAFVKITPNLGENLSLTANALVLDGDPGLGFELSGTIGNSLVLYSEVMAQRRLPLAAEALSDGSGSAGFREGIGADAGRKTQVQAVIGANWALPEAIVGAEQVSLVLEYHRNTGGLSGSEIDALADAAGPDLAAAGTLFDLANRRQEPLAEEQLFSSLTWTDAIGDSDLSFLAFLVPEDGSGLAQVSLDIPINDTATLALRGIEFFGSDASVYGSNPTERSLQAALIWRF
ncbi:hypothetical protein [uncultured Roseobacter sp.]|uniref:hypothetical protein n=1 Tax=uncultured Roseobacter sp. TaxID=114847 RepID=UPI002622A71F|nr:hypothetical protein [uncultured Roseobacter sp.]